MKKNNGGGEVKEEKGNAEMKSPDEPPTDYIHIRARRGQAKDRSPTIFLLQFVRYLLYTFP